jgi:hypothetical protein
MGPAVYARVGAVALWQVGLERLHHGAVAAACGGGGAAGAAAGCDGRPCGAVTLLKSCVCEMLRGTR